MERTVLVVDDEPMVRDVAQAILERLGMTVVAVANGAEALERVEAEPDHFDLVLLDLTMPGLSGAETLQKVHQVRPEIPVIVMSGYNEAEASGRFPGSELAGFLEKPFSTKGLSAAVEAVLSPREDTTAGGEGDA